MIAYDFEVFVYDWLVVFKDIATNETNIIINDDKKLKEFYDKHQNNVFVGYNNKSYDDIIFTETEDGYQLNTDDGFAASVYYDFQVKKWKVHNYH